MPTTKPYIWHLRAEPAGRYHFHRVDPDAPADPGEITVSMTVAEVHAAYRKQFPKLRDSEIQQRIDDARTLFERMQRMKPGMLMECQIAALEIGPPIVGAAAYAIDGDDDRIMQLETAGDRWYFRVRGKPSDEAFGSREGALEGLKVWLRIDRGRRV